MKNKINYSDEPMENVEIIEDFLPSPEELAFKEETVKITIALASISSKNRRAIIKHNTRS